MASLIRFLFWQYGSTSSAKELDCKYGQGFWEGEGYIIIALVYSTFYCNLPGALLARTLRLRGSVHS